MADRTYDLLIDTAENRKIAETLRRYNNIKDTHGEPNYLWKPPFISGQRNSLKGGCMCDHKMTGGAMPNSILEQMDEKQTLQRPRGMVSPYTQPPAKYIISGNRPYYPYYNSVELDALENRKVGSGFLGAMASQGIKSGVKYGAQAAKLGLAGAKQGAKLAVMVAKNPAVQAVVSEIAKDPEVQKAVVGQITTLIKGKATDNVVEETPALEGGKLKKSKTPRGKSDGRAKRAEIVKKVMKEHNLKLIEASKYVKANNLY